MAAAAGAIGRVLPKTTARSLAITAREATAVDVIFYPSSDPKPGYPQGKDYAREIGALEEMVGDDRGIIGSSYTTGGTFETDDVTRFILDVGANDIRIAVLIGHPFAAEGISLAAVGGILAEDWNALLNPYRINGVSEAKIAVCFQDPNKWNEKMPDWRIDCWGYNNGELCTLTGPQTWLNIYKIYGKEPGWYNPPQRAWQH
jgi:hypothetical protein